MFCFEVEIKFPATTLFCIGEDLGSHVGEEKAVVVDDVDASESIEKRLRSKSGFEAPHEKVETPPELVGVLVVESERRVVRSSNLDFDFGDV